MKIKNTTGFPDAFVRNMASWVCRELELSQRQVRLLQVGRKVRTQGWSGMCYGRRVIVNVHPRIGTTAQIIHLVEGMGHELFHTVQFIEGLWGSGKRAANIENAAIGWGKQVQRAFLANREALIQEWAS